MPDHSLTDLTRLDPNGTVEEALAARADAERRLQALHTQVQQLSGRVAQLEQERALLADAEAMEQLMRAWRAEQRADAQHLPPSSLEELYQDPSGCAAHRQHPCTCGHNNYDRPQPEV